MPERRDGDALRRLRPPLDPHGTTSSSSAQVFATPMDELPPDLADEVGLEEEDEAERELSVGERAEAVVDFSALHSLLVAAAIWGVLAREGLIALGSYAGLSVFPTLLAQVVGCWVMGLANQQKANLSNLYGPLFPFIATGFCGSVTTFSTWMLQVFQAFANSAGFRRHGLHNAVDGISQTATTMGMSAASITFGYQCGTLLLPRPDRLQPPDDGGGGGEKARRRPGDLSLPARSLIAVIGPALWVGAAVLVGVGPHAWRGKVTWSLVFGPVGTLLRFHLARLNSRPFSESRGFPLGTFAANILGTAVYALCAMLQISGSADGNALACAVLQGVRDGFCGCLTTVSTFAFELRNLAPKRAWRYALVSWAAGQIACVLLYGAYEWARGSKGQCALQ